MITLNQSHEPVLVTTVGTCGCYVSISRTDYTPKDALPAELPGDKLEIYGETLPFMLKYRENPKSRLLVWLGPPNTASRICA